MLIIMLIKNMLIMFVLRPLYRYALFLSLSFTFQFGGKGTDN